MKKILAILLALIMVAATERATGSHGMDRPARK